MINKYLIFCFTILLYGCGAGVGDSVKDLSGGYQYVSESNINSIITHSDKNTPKILCEVISYAWNTTYIVAKQRYYPPNNNIKSCKYEQKENIFNQKKGKIYYWIINIKEKKAYGPYLNRKDFFYKKNKLLIKLEL